MCCKKATVTHSESESQATGAQWVCLRVENSAVCVKANKNNNIRVLLRTFSPLLSLSLSLSLWSGTSRCDPIYSAVCMAQLLCFPHLLLRSKKKKMVHNPLTPWGTTLRVLCWGSLQHQHQDLWPQEVAHFRVGPTSGWSWSGGFDFRSGSSDLHSWQPCRVIQHQPLVLFSRKVWTVRDIYAWYVCTSYASCQLSTWYQQTKDKRLCILSSEPVWPSSKALGWLVEGPQFKSASAHLSLQELCFVDTVLWFCPLQLMKH